MKKIVVILVALVLLPNAFALQQIAGQLAISAPISGSGSAQYGLINDGNETIFIKLRAEGDAAPYLSFPTTVELVPNKIVYTDITANMPANYNGQASLSGSLYAVQEGKPGQVQINVQMKKSVIVSVEGSSTSASSPNNAPTSGSSGSGSSGTLRNTNKQTQPDNKLPDPQNQTTGSTQQPADNTNKIAENSLPVMPVTGLAASSPIDTSTGAAIAAIIIIILVAFAILKHFRKI